MLALFCGVNAYLLFVAGNALEFYNAVDESVQRVVAALAYVETRADVCASLSYDDVARKNCRAVGFFTPSLCALLSRPFFVEPTPFL